MPGTAAWAPTLLAAGLLAASCGGAAPRATGEPEPGPEQRARGAERAERSRLALVEGDLSRAGREAHAALTLSPDDPVAREVSARVALAEGRDQDALDLLDDARRPRLVRLRARARVRLGELTAAGDDLASVEDRPPADGWAEAMLPIARAAAGRSPYAMEGAERAELPTDGRSPVPVVEIVVDGRTMNALVATSADVTVLDDDLRATPGFADRIELGGVTVRDVPVLSRDLDDIAATLGVELGAVLGTDLLLRTSVTIDGPGGVVVIRREGLEADPDSPTVPFVTFEGTFLAVRATLEGTARGWYTLDTSGLFPVALGPLALEALDLDPAQLEPAPSAPSDEVRVTRLGTIRLGQVQMEQVPAVTGLVPGDLSELAGAPISGILGAALSQQLRLTIDPGSRRMYVE